MIAAGSVERHTGLPLSGKNLPPRALVCTSPRMSSIARSGPRFSWCLPKKTRPTKMWDSPTGFRRHARLFGEEPQERQPFWERALCHLQLACCVAAFAAVMWLAFQPDMENEDATIVGTVLWDWVGGPSLRGAGLGGRQAWTLIPRRSPAFARTSAAGTHAHVRAGLL